MDAQSVFQFRAAKLRKSFARYREHMAREMWEAVDLLLEHDVRPKFPTGLNLMTRGAQAAVNPCERVAALTRHISGDWGEVDAEDKAANDDALVDGTRLLSAYRTIAGEKFWVITEADRSATTILLPEEY